jgi:hypothetical protein
LGARVNARAIEALANLVGSGVSTPSAALSAVVEVAGEIGAVVATTGLSKVAAVVAAGPAIRVRPQIAAHSIANRGRAANVTSTGSAQAARVAATGLAGREALIPLRLGTPIAKGFAGVLAGSPDGPQPPRIEEQARDHGAHAPQRLAARHGSGQRHREFIAEIFHDRYLSHLEGKRIELINDDTGRFVETLSEPNRTPSESTNC